ncbi:hypothetical protein Dimus_006816 [Dionaea muscipula]
MKGTTASSLERRFKLFKLASNVIDDAIVNEEATQLVEDVLRSTQKALHKVLRLNDEDEEEDEDEVDYDECKSTTTQCLVFSSTNGLPFFYVIGLQDGMA